MKRTKMALISATIAEIARKEWVCVCGGGAHHTTRNIYKCLLSNHYL